MHTDGVWMRAHVFIAKTSAPIGAWEVKVETTNYDRLTDQHVGRAHREVSLPLN